MTLSDWVRATKRRYRSQGLLNATAESGAELARGIRRRAHPFGLYQAGYRLTAIPSQVDVMEREWDNLFILDACRYDYFTEQNPFEGVEESIVSQGSHSLEFMQNTFEGSKFHDTVYVTANPYAVRLPEDTFHDVELLLDEWDPESKTIHPETVAKAAEDVAREFPDKRLIVHFMQPHAPWIGPTAEELRQRVDLRGIDPKNGLVDQTDSEVSGITGFGAARRGEITTEEMEQAYAETLSVVLESVGDLQSQLRGKTAITADHGEHLGEQVAPLCPPKYCHPKNTWTPQLRVVPWFEFEHSERRDIEAEPPLEVESVSEDVIERRLEALGYA